MSRNSFVFIESEADLNDLKGRYSAFTIIPIILTIIMGIIMSISLLFTDLDGGLKIFLFILSLFLTALTCWIVLCSISVIRLFMYHMERINNNTDHILYKLEKSQVKNEKKEKNIDPSNIGKKICPVCKNTNDKENEKCIYCGTEFPKEKPFTFIDCKFCGARIKSTDTSCFNCGKKFIEEDKKKPNTCKYCGAIVKPTDTLCFNCGKEINIEEN